MEEVKKVKTEFEEEALEYTPEILPDTNIDSFIDDFQYGLSIPKLGKNKTISYSYNDLTDLPTLYQPKYYQVNDTRWNGWYTAGNFTITCGFRPKRIDLKAHTAGTNDWITIWTAIVDENWNIVNWCIFWDWSFTNIFDTSASSIWIIKSSSASTAITVTAISDTWFTININNNNWSFNTTFTVEW